jgi:hypothetical protein
MGDFIWAKQFTGTIYMYANALTVSAAGDVYVGGTFNNTVDFDPNAGTAYLTATSATDIFVCRLTASGDFVWVKRIGSDASQSVFAMEFAHDGGLLLTGYGDPLTDYDPDTAVVNLNDGGYIIKLTASGDFVWGTSLTGLGKAIDVESDGTILQLGDDMNYITLNKLDASGNVIWSKNFSGGYMSAGGVTHNPAGDIYVSGNFESTLTWGTDSMETLINSGSRDAFIIRFSPSGTTLNALQIGGGGYSSLNGLKFYNNTLTAAGYFSGSTDFDPGPSTVTASSTLPSWSDIAILELSPTGTFQCLSTLGSTQPDYPSSIVFDADGNLLITGHIGDTTDMDPGAGTALLFYGANFIAQYEMCATAAGIEEAASLQRMFCQPNPATGIIKITAEGDAIFHIYTIEGKIVKEGRFSNNHLIDLSNLDNGLYTVLLLQENKKVYQKIVVSR